MEMRAKGIKIENPADCLHTSAFKSFHLISHFTLAATREKEQRGIREAGKRGVAGIIYCSSLTEDLICLRPHPFTLLSPHLSITPLCHFCLYKYIKLKKGAQ